ncbi:MAG: glycosyltransferase family 9 protein, partial [Phycisphaerae bacterium]
VLRRRGAQAQIAHYLRRATAGGTPALRNGGGAGVSPALRMGWGVWSGRGYRPVPTIEYYLGLLGPWPNMPSAPPPAPLGMAPDGPLHQMTLGLTDSERNEAQQVLASQGIDPGDDLVVLVPGANFGSSKCWPSERFAQVADLLMDRQGAYKATVLLAGSPAEKPIIEAIVAGSQLAPRGRLIALSALNAGRGVSLGCVKALVARARLMICNDTGPRHFACALGVPVVTLFGPTDPVWAETYYDRERLVRMVPPPACGPCQLKRCPIDHRCMMGLEVADVMRAVAELWSNFPRISESGADAPVAPGGSLGLEPPQSNALHNSSNSPASSPGLPPGATGWGRAELGGRDEI